MYNDRGIEKQVVDPEWLAMYFAPEWDSFQKQIKKIVFETGYTEKEVFDIFCECYRTDKEDELDELEQDLFSELNVLWWSLSTSFHEKHNPLEIMPDYYDAEDSNEVLTGGFICMIGAYILHPMAERIYSAFNNHSFKKPFKGKHKFFFNLSK